MGTGLNLGEGYSEFRGRFVDAMLALRADQMTAMASEGLAKRRLEVLASEDEQLIEAWLFNYFCTPDSIAYSGNELKFTRNNQLLLDVTPDSVLKNGLLLELTDKQYRQMPGKTFKRSELILNKPLTRAQAKKHGAWQELLGETLDPYADAIFDQVEKRFGEDRAMGVYVLDMKPKTLYVFDIKPKTPVLAACNVNGFYDDDVSGLLGGLYGLNYDGTCLVGVRPEKVGKPKVEGLDEVVKAIQAGKGFKFGGKAYVPVDQKALDF